MARGTRAVVARVTRPILRRAAHFKPSAPYHATFPRVSAARRAGGATETDAASKVARAARNIAAWNGAPAAHTVAMAAAPTAHRFAAASFESVVVAEPLLAAGAFGLRGFRILRHEKSGVFRREKETHGGFLRGGGGEDGRADVCGASAGGGGGDGGGRGARRERKGGERIGGAAAKVLIPRRTRRTSRRSRGARPRRGPRGGGHVRESVYGDVDSHVLGGIRRGEEAASG